jgi:hypothetical protein
MVINMEQKKYKSLLILNMIVSIIGLIVSFFGMIAGIFVIAALIDGAAIITNILVVVNFSVFPKIQKFCPKCGIEINDNHDFCPKCGSPLK